MRDDAPGKLSSSPTTKVVLADPPLNAACQLIDYLVADMAVAGLKPTVVLQAAKKSFDLTMKDLVGERTFAKIGKPIDEIKRKSN